MWSLVSARQTRIEVVTIFLGARADRRIGVIRFSYLFENSRWWIRLISVHHKIRLVPGLKYQGLGVVDSSPRDLNSDILFYWPVKPENLLTNCCQKPTLTDSSELGFYSDLHPQEGKGRVVETSLLWGPYRWAHTEKVLS